MKKKTASSNYVTRQNTIMIALICLFVGFILGAGFTSFKLTNSSSSETNNHGVVDYEKKEKEFKDVLAKNPGNVSAWTQLGHVYFDTDQFPKAIEAYKKSLSLESNNPDILTDLGIMYRRNKQPEKAIASFDRAILIDHRHESSRFNKGIVLMNDLNEQNKALDVWEKLLEINPIAMASKDQSLDQLIKHYKEH